MTDTPQIYVACLSSYNGGKLHGRWIDCDQFEEQIQEEVDEMLRDSPDPDAEEWAIHDFQNFGSYEVSEYENFETVSALAAAIIEHGEAIIDLHEELSNDDILVTVRYWEDNYHGTFNSEEEYAEQYVNDTCIAIPEFLQWYIDYEKMGKELLNDCTYFWNAGELHVFFNS